LNIISALLMCLVEGLLSE